MISNGMKFTKGKRRVLHLGWSNARHRYRLGDEQLDSNPAERDLGKLADSRLNVEPAVCQEAKTKPRFGIQ